MISIVFGKPGAGKTAFLVANALPLMDSSADARDFHASCLSQIRTLNAAGAEYTEPRFGPVYSNFPIRFQMGMLPVKESYYIDGFHLGFPNEFVDVMPVYPGSSIFLSEAQRYYNSRKSKDLPDWVSRFYEEHRHFGLNIMMDVQRPGLIDVNIRELAERFYEVVELRFKQDHMGSIESCIFKLRVFEDWKFVDKYITNDASTFQEVEYRYPGNVFASYNSHSYFNNFLPNGCDFSHWLHPRPGVDQEALGVFQDFYSQTPPEGFYPGRSKKER